MPPVVRAEPAAARPAGEPDAAVPAISLRGVRKEFPGGVVAVHGPRPRHRRRRVRHAARAVRLGQDDGAAADRRLRAADRRHGGAARRATSPRRRRSTATCTPSSRTTRSSRTCRCCRNVEYPLRIAKVGRAERRERAMEALATVRLDGMADRSPDRAVRWAAPAGGAGPRAGRPPVRAPARRAARRARPQAARADAGRAQADPAGVGHHVRAGHPRPGRGAHARRPDRRVQRGPGRAGRVGARGLRAAGDGVRRRLRRHLQRAAARVATHCSAATGPGACARRRSASRSGRRAAPPGATTATGTVSELVYTGPTTRCVVDARRPAARLTVLLLNGADRTAGRPSAASRCGCPGAPSTRSRLHETP